MVVVLPAPLTPTTKTTHGRAENAPALAPGRSQRADELGAQQRPHRSRAAARDLAAPGAQQLERLAHRGQAEVGLEQRLLDLVERLGVERAAAAREVLERRLQHLARAGEPAAQAVEERH